jgi:esterase/lipase superfamily enzyme
MVKEITSWFSPALQEEMPIATYGYFGFALLLIPTAAADFLEYERFQLIDALSPHIHAVKIKVFSISSMNNQSWMNDNMEPAHKAIRQNQINEYVHNEVFPYIRRHTSNNTLIFTCGASFGALHAMNLFLKRPDIINGAISMSGVYDLTEYTKGYWDEQVYYNSPQHYIPNLTDPWFLDKIKASHHIHIYSGSGAYEDPEASRRFSKVLWDKGIWNDLEIWGNDIPHDWPTWRKMLPLIIEQKF